MANIVGNFFNRRQPTIPKKLPIHHHDLDTSVFPFDCYGCSILKDGEGYHCPRCKIYFHKECAESPPEINHPSHPTHPLKLLVHELPGYSDGKCRLCGEELRELVYHCSICNFSLDTACAQKQKIVNTDCPKAHEHSLNVFPREVPFICDACGMDGDQCPYLCHQCNFIIHKDCIDLPRVIRIIRHEHRISRTYFVGRGELACKVCRLEIDGRYGAYYCSICPEYVVHLRCATKDGVWDGRELEDEEENDEGEDIEPFKVINSNVISHFGHEHHLNLDEDDNVCNETIHCLACALPVYFDPFYSCPTCDFVLHKACANLPRKIRHGLHEHPLTLSTTTRPGKDLETSLFYCTACKRLCSGFRYACCDVEIDVRCGSICEPFIHESHPHPLFLTSLDANTCGACNKEASFVLNCIDCDFVLGFDCATLPTRVKHKYDRHFLSLCLGEKTTSSIYWCEICEKETDPNTPFYTCDECCSTLHTGCVLGDFTCLRPYQMVISNYQDVAVVPNNFISRPHCRRCGLRCEGTSVVLVNFLARHYLCSLRCFNEGYRFFLLNPKVKLWELPELSAVQKIMDGIRVD